MAIDQERINTRASYGMLAGVLIASVALGLIIWKVGDSRVFSSTTIGKHLLFGAQPS